MKTILQRLWPALLVLGIPVATGCVTSTEPAVGDAFDLVLGNAADVDGSLHVRFADVGGDSRCATGVQCIWAGDAVVRLQLAVGQDSAGVELHTNGGAGVTRADFGQFTIELVQLAPYPEANKPIERSKYTATLRATRR